MSSALTLHKPTLPAVKAELPNIGINKQQKAAILLNVLLRADAAPNLDDIETSSLKNIVDTMTSFGDVDRTTVDTVILEFLTELQEFGISLSADLEEAIASLKGHISDNALDNIRKSYVGSPAVDVWKTVASAETADLCKCLNLEHVQVAAIVLSKIPSTKAAEALSLMEPPRAREVMLAIINAGEVKPEIIEIIGQSICSTLFDSDGPSVFDKPPVERVGDIMNYANSEMRDKLLEEFGKDDPSKAAQIRKAMFTFADIPSRIEPRDVSAVTRAINPEALLRALKGAETEAPESVEFILSSLSTRAADQLREELAETEPAKKKDMETAMNEMIAAIRQLEADGAITLIFEEED